MTGCSPEEEFDSPSGLLPAASSNASLSVLHGVPPVLTAVLVLAGLAVVAMVAALVVPRVLGMGAPQVIATARLVALPEWSGASGTATLERLRDRRRELRLQLATPAVGGDDRELWLMDPRAGALVSLVVVDRSTAAFAVPNDLDLTAYDVVDVSRERPDGDPAHSGDPVFRGKLSS